MSFLSLVLSSAKLFYSQRLGNYLELDPSFKMIIYAALPICFQLLFPLFSLILSASGGNGLVLAQIASIMLANFVVTKSMMTKSNFVIKDLYGHDNRDNQKKGRKESDEIFNTAIFTSWISPCTVWSNNHRFKSNFLIVNSLTTLLGHALSIFCAVFLADLRTLSQSENHPITLCYRNQSK